MILKEEDMPKSMFEALKGKAKEFTRKERKEITGFNNSFTSLPRQAFLLRNLILSLIL